MSSLKRVFGIDLGTTYSCIAYVDEFGKPITVQNAETERITPSVVFFDGPSVIVGSVAKSSAKLYPHAIVELVKRSMGDPNYLFQHEGRTYRAEEISAFILRKVVGDAEAALGEPIRDVVITIPAYFGVNEREATARAGQIAGLNVWQIINEPTAAAIAYGMDRADDQVVLVYDLGGGTFDVTMIEIKSRSITVLCTGGDHNLGGKDWDLAVVNYLAAQFREQTGSPADILDDPETLQELFSMAEQAKKTLSTRDRVPLKVSNDGKSAKVELIREVFEDLTAPLLERTITLTEQMLAEAAQKGHGKFAKILLVGGSTRMPQVPRRLKEAFGVDCELLSPDESVATGAALFGWKLAIDEEIKRTVAEQTGQAAAAVDLDRVGTQALDEAADDLSTRFGLPTSTIKRTVGTKIVNVTSKTFGIVAVDREGTEWVYNLIARNDPVPKAVEKTFGTVLDHQPAVEVRLMENLDLGPTTALEHATELGNAELPLPTGLPAGSPIRVQFTLNEQGRLEVTASEPRTGRDVRLEIQTASVMSQEEVEEARARGLAIPVS